VNPQRHVADAALADAVGGRLVLVTGASHGIGRATSVRLAAAGARLLLVARSAELLDELAGSLGSGARALACDLADPDQVSRLVEALRDEPVEVVVSNAGKSIRRSIADSHDRMHDFTRTIAINYLGPVQLLLGLLPAMRARGRGHIVNVSTVGLLLPPAPRWSAYLASKGAFDTWLRSAAAEAAADGITVSSVYMALVHTRMSAPTSDFDGVPGLTPEQAAEIVAHAIVKRPAAVAPWWASAVGAAADLARGPSDMLMRRYGRRTAQ
jgi:NAD(P)-dependent dehydrogenase (short-subunit alcohol dehydrogenase family)